MSAKARMLATASLLSLTASPAQASDALLYLQSYEGSRAAFKALGHQLGSHFKNVLLESILVPSRIDADLTIDSIYIPAQEAAEGLVVVTSGVHGVEAGTGAAIQRLLLGGLLAGGRPAFAPTRTGFLFVHALNPFGFKYGRRATENNVDLNRNFSATTDLFQHKNPDYARLETLLSPSKPATSSWRAHLRFLFNTVRELTRNSGNALAQAIAQGQYEFPKGLFYGGSAFEPQNAPLAKLLRERAAGYGKALLLDLHTGYGRKGYMHLFPNPLETEAERARSAAVFGNYPVEQPGKAGFYASTGDFSDYAGKLLAEGGRSSVSMVLEFGTLDSQTRTGAIKSISRLILENQLYWNGSADPGSTSAIRLAFAEMFFPSDLTWRKTVLAQAGTHIPNFIERFTAMRR